MMYPNGIRIWFSNMDKVAYGIYGLLGNPRSINGSRLISYCGLIGVGVCSAAYHMTLKYHTQMCMFFPNQLVHAARRIDS